MGRRDQSTGEAASEFLAYWANCPIQEDLDFINSQLIDTSDLGTLTANTYTMMNINHKEFNDG